jgi:HNH endonuclease
MAYGPKPKPLGERIAAKTIYGEHHIWTGATNGVGYGMVRVTNPRRNMLVHRAVWELEHGPIPSGLFVLHHCDTPPCHKFGHLFLGTQADNVADMLTKGRHFEQGKTHCPQGHPYDEANTYIYRGCRYCRECHRARRRSGGLRALGEVGVLALGNA